MSPKEQRKPTQSGNIKTITYPKKIKKNRGNMDENDINVSLKIGWFIN